MAIHLIGNAIYATFLRTGGMVDGAPNTAGYGGHVIPPEAIIGAWQSTPEGPASSLIEAVEASSDASVVAARLALPRLSRRTRRSSRPICPRRQQETTSLVGTATVSGSSSSAITAATVATTTGVASYTSSPATSPVRE